MSLWLKNGRLLILNGKAVECDYCPCDDPSVSSGSSASASDCDECYNCIVVCGMNIATPFTIYVNGIAATLPVASVDPFQAAGSVDIGCSILDIIVSFDEDCNFTISIDGVVKALAPDDYESAPDFTATTTVSHATCGTLLVNVYNGGAPQNCSLVCCDPSVSGSSSSSSGSQIQCDAPCPQGMPDHLTATLANVDNCSCYDGVTVSLAWDDLQNVWVGEAAGCTVDGCIFRITVQCDGILINHGFVVSIEGCTSSFGQNLLAECGPFELQGDFSIDAGTSPCCGCGLDGHGGGTIQITVTE